MAKAHWHYPRTDFARQVHSLLANGPVQAVSLFAPRRTGKTQFLIQDLAPLAERKGHRVVYASLWQTVDSPLGILLYEFDRALRGGTILDRVKSTVGGIAPKFTLKDPFGVGELEVDLDGIRGTPPADHLLLLDRYCEKLASDRKPAFLLFDEFQELARARDAAPLIAALRTSLDKRKDGLVAVFTGSSQDGLRRMFSARQAPFFRFAQPIDLPALDDRFVVHQLASFHASSRARISMDEALRVFERCEANPWMFQSFLVKLAVNVDMSINEAMDAVQAEISEEFGFTAQWLKLTAIQRATARLLAARVSQVYGLEGARFLSGLTGAPAPEPSAIQTAIGRLSRLGLVDKWESEWRIADPLFESWIRGRPDSEF